MKISTIRGLQGYLEKNSGFSTKTINSVITALGYQPSNCKRADFKELSQTLKECSEHGADSGFSGFIYYSDTLPFTKRTAWI